VNIVPKPVLLGVGPWKRLCAVFAKVVHKVLTPLATLLDFIIGNIPTIFINPPVLHLFELTLTLRNMVKPHLHVCEPDNGTWIRDVPSFLLVVPIDSGLLVSIMT